jgi:hypothetical protein
MASHQQTSVHDIAELVFVCSWSHKTQQERGFDLKRIVIYCIFYKYIVEVNEHR